MTTVLEKIHAGVYEVESPPTAPRMPVPVFRFGDQKTLADDLKHHATAIAQWSIETKRYEEELQDYATKLEFLSLQFQHDLAIEHGLENHPMSSSVFAMACRLVESNAATIDNKVKIFTIYQSAAKLVLQADLLNQ